MSNKKTKNRKTKTIYGHMFFFVLKTKKGY